MGTCVFLTSADQANFNVNSLVCGAGRPDTGFLSILSQGLKTAINNGVEVRLAALEELAASLRHMIVPVYDSETYLVWSALAR